VRPARRAVAERILPDVACLQPTSLSRALHAFTSLQHSHPQLVAALAEEAHARLTLRAAGRSGVAQGPGSFESPAGGFTQGLIGLAATALFGRVVPDRGVGAAPFTLPALARLAAAAVHMGATQPEAVRLLAAVAEAAPRVLAGRQLGSSGAADVDLEPMLSLLAALLQAALTANEPVLCEAAQRLAAQHLAPRLAALAEQLTAAQLVLLVALQLPFPALAASHAAMHPYPLHPASRAESPDAATGRDSQGELLLLLAGALRQRSEAQPAVAAPQVLAAWRLLASALALGSVEASVGREAAAELWPCVAAAVPRNRALLAGWAAPDAAAFIVSCALLGAYDRKALDAAAAPLFASLAAEPGPSSQGPVGLGAQGRKSSPARQARARPLPSWQATTQPSAAASHSLTPAGLAQLGWAVGQLSYANEALLEGLQVRGSVKPMSSSEAKVGTRALVSRHPFFYTRALVSRHPFFYTTHAGRGPGVECQAAAFGVAGP
jgi:hypothetical protein